MSTMQRRFLAPLGLLCACVSLAACGSTTMLTTGAKQPPRPQGCDFQVLTGVPASGYSELGTIDVQPGGWGSNVYTHLDGFKEKIQPYVCEAGGDAALAVANGYGMYIKATILKRTGAAAPAADPSHADAAGCQFDTQCKGERVCVKGECVDPAKKVAPSSAGVSAERATPE
jgi:hypothetical protein